MAFYRSSEAAEIGITAAFAFLVIADLFGNSLVCLVVFRNRVMRIPMNLLLVNLALADMTLAVFVAFRFIFTLMFRHPEGKAGDVVCKLLTGGPFLRFGGHASVISLVCIALERYHAVKFPYDKHKQMTATKLKRMIVVIWGLAISWNMPLFWLARYDPVVEFCVFHWPSDNVWQFYTLANVMACGVLPITIMVYLYSKLVYMLWFRPTPGSNLAQQRKLKYCKKTARLVITVSVIYFVCWSPVLVTYALSSFATVQMFSSVHTIGVVLITLNSAINPVLYSLQSDRFRKHMLALLPFSRCSRRSCKVLPANLVTPTDTVSMKTASLTRAKTLPLESRGPTA